MDHQEAIRTGAAERYILGEMTAGERDRFEEHYFICRDCADDIRAISLMIDGIREESKQNVTPIRKPRVQVPKWWSVAAAAVLACVVCYQSLVIIPGLRQGGGDARQVAVYLLRPETRSSARVIQRAEGQPVVLSLDVPIAPSTRNLQALVQRAEGGTVASIPVALADSESRAFLQLPSSLKPGAYTIVLRSNNSEAGRYQFQLQ